MNDRNLDRGSVWRALDSSAARVGNLDLWPSIRGRLLGQTTPILRKSTSRVRWAVGLLVGALLIGTGVYAGGSLLREAYEINPSWQKAAAGSQQVHFTQTQEDCTVTIEQVYADHERVVLGLTVEGPAGESLSPGDARLVTQQGTVLPFIDGGGNSQPESGAFSWVLTFDASPLKVMPAELPLHFSFRLSAIPIHKAAPPMAPPANTEGDATVVELAPIETRWYGPFTFELTVPVSR